jgi:dihydrofolate synthase/folylpolyglutamate synthase
VNYDGAVSWLYATQLHGIHLGLENIQRLVAALGIRVAGPDAPKFLHVAGTNGKGSVCAMLDSCCRAAGLKTGLFTSPHLVTFRERMRIDGEMISEDEVAAGLEKIRALVETWDHAPTFFEIATALALAWFQERGAEVVVLETGLGGRLDATNVVTPVVSLLTRIDLDHQQWLGDSLPAIALEKAGIIKPNVPVVTGPQADDVRAVIAQIAMWRDAELNFVVSPFRSAQIGLAGSHQGWNAALAAHALKVAGMAVSDEDIRRGLSTVEWPGRFQQITPNVVLDGAHNPASAQRLAETWREIFGDKRATLILGVLQDKDVRGICEALLPIAGRIIALPVQNPRSATPQEVCRAIGQVAPRQECIAVRDLPAALRIAESMGRRVLITGSLFLVGEALAHFQMGGAVEVSAQ